MLRRNLAISDVSGPQAELPRSVSKAVRGSAIGSAAGREHHPPVGEWHETYNLAHGPGSNISDRRSTEHFTLDGIRIHNVSCRRLRRPWLQVMLGRTLIAARSSGKTAIEIRQRIDYPSGKSATSGGLS
jgi:hypothetical protein